MSSPETIREEVRQRYAEAASRSAGDRNHTRAVEASCCAAPVATTEPHAGTGAPSCCGAPPVATTDLHGRAVFGAELYGPDSTQGAPDAAVALAASLGCGVPTAVADLHPGEVVLDLGSGAGGDVIISAGRVAPGGRAIGLETCAGSPPREPASPVTTWLRSLASLRPDRWSPTCSNLAGRTSCRSS